MTVARPAGWVQRGGRWERCWNGRCVANIVPQGECGVRLLLVARNMAQAKVVSAANTRQAKRYAERWCAARLCPGMPLREAVARLVDTARPPIAALTRQQRQQARRLAEAGAGEIGRIKEALAQRRPAVGTLAQGQARNRPG